MHTMIHSLTMNTTRAKGVMASLLAATLLLSGTAQAQELTFGYVPAAMQYPYNVATA